MRAAGVVGGASSTGGLRAAEGVVSLAGRLERVADVVRAQARVLAGVEDLAWRGPAAAASAACARAEAAEVERQAGALEELAGRLRQHAARATERARAVERAADAGLLAGRQLAHLVGVPW